MLRIPIFGFIDPQLSLNDISQLTYSIPTVTKRLEDGGLHVVDVNTFVSENCQNTSIKYLSSPILADSGQQHS